MKSFFHTPLVLTLLSLLFLHTSPLFGQAATEATKVHKIPFHGTVTALDASAQTITLNGKSARVLHLAPTTKIIDGSGNPTTFSTASVGEAVSGSYIKDAAGTLTLSSLRIGAKDGSKAAKTAAAPASAPVQAAPTASPSAPPIETPTTTATTTAAPAAAAPAAAKKSSFSGKVTAVDAAANTFSIKSRTFAVTGSTKFTGSVTSLADLQVSTKVSGSALKSADGSLTAVTLKSAP